METPQITRRNFFQGAFALGVSGMTKEFPAPNEYYESLPLEDKVDFAWGVVQILVDRIEEQNQRLGNLEELARKAMERYFPDPPVTSSPESDV